MRLDFVNSTSKSWLREKLTTLFCVALILLSTLVSGRLQAGVPSTGDTNVQPSEHAKLIHKLQTLFIKKVDLDNATIKEALKFLIDESKKSDPEHQGINFVLEAKPNTYVPLGITIKYKNVVAIEVLKSIREQSGFAYSVGDSSIYVWHDDGEGLTKRTFTVWNGFVEIKPDTVADETKRAYDVRDQLMAKGVRFAPGTSAFYLPARKELIVTNDPDQIELIDEFVYAGKGAGLHITKATKFIEIQ